VAARCDQAGGMKELVDLSALTTRDRLRSALGPCTPDVDPLVHIEGVVAVVQDARFHHFRLRAGQGVASLRAATLRNAPTNRRNDG
jgi:hypothetical protein